MTGDERKGRLTSWDDAKGFGFIQPAGGGAEVFAHISVMRGDRRPQPGDDVLFIEGRDERGRLRARHLRLAGELSLDHEAIRRKPKPTGHTFSVRPRPLKKTARLAKQQGNIRSLGTKAVLFALLCILPVLASLPPSGRELRWLLPLYVVASLLSFVQYWLDKRSAQSGGQRTPENTLHLVELLGGWPGALIAQHVFRHKTRKDSYQAVFWLIVAAHQLLWVDLLFDGTFVLRYLPSFVQ